MWDDLNIPARVGTLAAAGLPMILRRNTGHIVASKELSEQYGIGILYDSITELSAQLYDRDFMDTLKRNVRKHRMEFTMDTHTSKLIHFFQSLI